MNEEFDDIEVLNEIQQLKALGNIMMCTNTKDAITLPEGTLYSIGLRIVDSCANLQKNIFND